MNRPSLLLLCVTAVCALALSSANAASSRENKRLQEGKITKNEAQHLVLKKFPGAKIKSCELKSADGHSFWKVDVLQSGSQSVTTVQVDGKTGKITP